MQPCHNMLFILFFFLFRQKMKVFPLMEDTTVIKDGETKTQHASLRMEEMFD
jgi:hypothetical protein